MEVRTQDEFDRARQVSQEIGRFWLGGSDIQQGGVWIWESNGERINRNQFWSTNEPNGGTDQNCLFFELPSDSVGLASGRCQNARGFACEFN